MKRTAEIAMIIVTILWGVNFISGKLILDSITPLLYSSIRFIGATIFLCIVYNKRLKRMDKPTLIAGLLIGAALGIGYILQTVGLNYATASKAGFLTGLFVVLVPVLECTIRRSRPRFNELLGVMAATMGLGLLSLNGSFGIGFGDAMLLLSAISFSVSIILISHFAKDYDPVILTIIQIAVTAVLSFVSAIILEPTVSMNAFNSNIVLLLLYAIFFGTAINTVVQNWAQSKLSATSASIILILEPVFAGIFGYLLLHDPMGIKELIGSFMIIGGMLITLLVTPKDLTQNTLKAASINSIIQ